MRPPDEVGDLAPAAAPARAGSESRLGDGRRRTSPAVWRLMPPLLIGLGLLALLALTFRPVVEGDGIGYASYLHAVFVGHGLDFGDEYAAARAAHVPLSPPLIEARTANGHLADYFPVGPAVLSSPLYLAALALRPAGEPQYGALFQGAFVIASLLYGLLALAICWRLTRSAVALVAVAAGTPYAYYLLTDPSYSHTFSAFAVSLFLLVWWRGRGQLSAARWLLLGALGGLMGLVRFEDGLLMAICLLDLRSARWRLLLLVPGTLAVFAPQVWVDQSLFGTWLPQRPAGQNLTLTAGHQLQVLFASGHGLFVWHPATLLAVGGFAFVRDRRLQLACVLAFVIETLVNGTTPDWSGGAAFGARRFLDLTPFFALGLAALAERAGAPFAWTVTAVLVAWNVLLTADFDFVLRTIDDPGYAGLLRHQLHPLAYVPRLAAQGAVVRDLGLWRLVGRPLAIGPGLALLAAEAACVAAALALALSPARLTRRPGSGADQG